MTPAKRTFLRGLERLSARGGGGGFSLLLMGLNCKWRRHSSFLCLAFDAGAVHRADWKHKRFCLAKDADLWVRNPRMTSLTAKSAGFGIRNRDGLAAMKLALQLNPLSGSRRGTRRV